MIPGEISGEMGPSPSGVPGGDAGSGADAPGCRGTQRPLHHAGRPDEAEETAVRAGGPADSSPGVPAGSGAEVPPGSGAGVPADRSPGVPAGNSAEVPARGQPTHRHRGPHFIDAPYAIVLAIALAGLLWVWQSENHVKGGMVTVSAALLVAAAARFVLPDQRAGLLANRRRGIDVTALTVLGAGLLAAALVIPSPS